MCVSVCVCVCVCVCLRERMCVCVCECVCVFHASAPSLDPVVFTFDLLGQHCIGCHSNTLLVVPLQATPPALGELADNM